MGEAAKRHSNWSQAGLWIELASAFLIVVLGLLVSVGTSRAQAATPTTFGETGEGAGQIRRPLGTDVDQGSGRLFLADRENFRVDRFSASGEFELAWGIGVRESGSPDFQTCGPQATPPGTRCFAASGSGRTSTAPGALQPTDVAVDQSSHDVYVSGGGYRVQKFSPDGAFLLLFGEEVNKTTGADVCTAPDAEAGDECGEGLRNDEAGTTYENAFYGGDFGSELPLAVGPEGHVWVLDQLWLREFAEDGEFLERFALPAGFTKATDLAVDSEGHIYAVGDPAEGVQEFEVTGPGALTEVRTVDQVPARYKAIALDASGNLYVSDRLEFEGQAVFRVFDPAGEQIEQFGAGQVAGTTGPQGVAVGDTAEALYSDSEGSGAFFAQRFTLPEAGPLPESEEAAEVLPTEATLKATLNPEGKETSYHFEWGTDEGYGQESPPATLAAGFEGKPVEAHLEHLTPETTYHWRLVAENENGTYEGPDRTFQARPAVAVESEFATDVTATAASFHALLDPLGPEAEWWLEYGTGESYGLATPAQILPAGFGAQPVEAHVQGLEPATVYHWRFAARDEREGTAYTSHGADRTLRTQLTAAGFTLPDGRAWEMVSPVDKQGGEITFDFDGLGIWRAAADGGAVTYLSLGSIVADPEGNRALEKSQLLGRHGSSGWSSTDITLPHTAVTKIAPSNGFEYRLFSPDLSGAVVEPRDTTLLSPEASERTPYLRSNFTEPATYDPLVTGKAPWANVPPGTEFGGEPTNYQGSVIVSGATPDLSRVILRSKAPLAGAPANALYEWAAGRLQILSVLPEGEGGATAEGELGGGLHGVSGAVSTDGSRVFWSNNQGTALYMRDTSAGETIRLDTVQTGATGLGAAAPIFLGAAADGSRAIFTDSQQLTADSNASESAPDLYACEVATGAAGEPECRLTDLTASGSEGAGVLGVAAIGEDGEDVYFAANGVLTGAEQNAQGGSAGLGSCSTIGGLTGAGTCNLYLAHYDGASWSLRFIATISQGDSYDWGGNLGGQAFERTAAASPDGRYLAFMSKRSLTGYDNRDAASGESDEEVFRYDSTTDRLVCASCDPSGARPHGVQLEKTTAARQVDQGQFWTGSGIGEKGPWLAAILPDPIAMSSNYSTYQPRYMLNDGRVFFNAVDALVPGDSNGTWDVYQYESTGNGDCTSGSGGAATSRSADGCVGLLTAGTGGQESAFVDAGTNGDDAFVLTAAKLSPEDVDSDYDVYDAHVCGSGWSCEAPEPAPPAPCESGSSCHPATPAAGPSAPSTAGFAGAGNVRQGPDCSAKGRKAKSLSHRARKLRHEAKLAARHGHPQTAHKSYRKARRLAKAAKREGAAAKHCRSQKRKASR